MNLDLDLLTHFVAVAEELHFGRAAQRLYLSQPALSRQIRRLEEQVGTQLFTRTSRRVELTAAGAVLLQAARRALEQVERAVDDARRASRGESGYLRVGFRESAAVALLPELVRWYRQWFPGVTLTLDELDDYEQCVRLTDGRLDIGFVRSVPITRSVVSEVLLDEPYVAVLPESHRLARSASLSLAALAEEQFVLWRRGFMDPAYDELMEACRRHGFTPQIALETINSHTILALVAAGVGVSLLAYSYRHLHRPGLVLVPVDNVRTSLRLAWHEDNRSLLVERFCTAARAIAARLEPGIARPPDDSDNG